MEGCLQKVVNGTPLLTLSSVSPGHIDHRNVAKVTPKKKQKNWMFPTSLELR